MIGAGERGISLLFSGKQDGTGIDRHQDLINGIEVAGGIVDRRIGKSAELVDTVHITDQCVGKDVGRQAVAAKTSMVSASR